MACKNPDPEANKKKKTIQKLVHFFSRNGGELVRPW
jgi:hypothetical protein